MTTHLRSAVGALCAGLLLAACSTGTSGGDVDLDSLEPEVRELVEQAQDAGPVTFYSMIDEEALRTISQAFTEEYGVDIEPVRLVSADLTQRYSAEASAGQAVADVLLLTHSPFFAEALDNGWMSPITDRDLDTALDPLEEEFLVDDGSTAIVSLIPTDTVINADLVESAPTEWTDYADASYSGALMLAEPDSSPANAAFWSLMREEFGDEFLQGVADNDPTWTSSAVPVSQAVAAGEASLGHPGVAAIVKTLQDSGAPVERVALTPTTGPEAAIGLSADSPNPAGAELMARFLLSEEGNALLNDETDALSPYDTDGLSGFTRVSDIELTEPSEIRSLLGLR